MFINPRAKENSRPLHPRIAFDPSIPGDIVMLLPFYNSNTGLALAMLLLVSG